MGKQTTILASHVLFPLLIQLSEQAELSPFPVELPNHFLVLFFLLTALSESTVQILMHTNENYATCGCPCSLLSRKT